MKVIERAIMPNGTEIQLEDWSKDYPGILELIIAAYPIAKKSDKYNFIRSGEKFRLEISCGNNDFKAIYQALKRGEKSLEDLSEHFYRGKEDMFFLGMTV